MNDVVPLQVTFQISITEDGTNLTVICAGGRGEAFFRETFDVR